MGNSFSKRLESLREDKVDKELNDLKQKIKDSINALDKIQKRYKELTGQEFKYQELYYADESNNINQTLQLTWYLKETTNEKEKGRFVY